MVPEVIMTVVANADVETATATTEAMQVALSSVSGVPADDITIAIESGSVVLNISFVLISANSTASLDDALASLNSESMSRVLDLPVERMAVASGVRNVTITKEVEVECQPGHWCTAGIEVDCEPGFYNPYPKANNQSACQACPERASTLHAASIRVAQCICEPGFYDEHMDDRVHCVTCPSGTNCSASGANLLSLPVRRGYYRHSDMSANVWPCPDKTLSGCKGTVEDDAQCFEGLAGVFCELCSNGSSNVYYKKAVDDMEHSTCLQCGDLGTMSDPVNVLAFLAFAVLSVHILSISP